ncbi:TPA: hypothetical protein QDB31_005909 [Burkholderia vietnamiensis]|nr:hypothetical protein [Burkholderia vietnamiensis]
MKSEDFSKCREFLEDQLSKNIDNKDLLSVYQKLIELKSQYDLATDKAVIEKELKQAELDAQYHTTVQTSNVDYNKAIHKNNTDYNIAANNNATQFQQHQMTTQAGIVNSAMGHPQFWNHPSLQSPGNY